MAYNSFVMHQNQILKKFYGFVLSLDTFCILMTNFEFLKFLTQLGPFKGSNFFKKFEK